MYSDSKAWYAYRNALDRAPSGSYQQMAIIMAGPGAFTPNNPTGINTALDNRVWSAFVTPVHHPIESAGDDD